MNLVYLCILCYTSKNFFFLLFHHRFYYCYFLFLLFIIYLIFCSFVCSKNYERFLLYVMLFFSSLYFYFYFTFLMKNTSVVHLMRF